MHTTLSRAWIARARSEISGRARRKTDPLLREALDWIEHVMPSVHECAQMESENAIDWCPAAHAIGMRAVRATDARERIAPEIPHPARRAAPE